MNNATQHGFMALVSMIMLALGTFAFSISTTSAAIAYADSVYAREMRIQRQLNQQGCTSSIQLMKIIDYFMNGEPSCSDIGF